MIMEKKTLGKEFINGCFIEIFCNKIINNNIYKNNN